MKKIVLIALAAAAVAAWVRWRPFRVAVAGPSMEPELLEGDWAIAVRIGEPMPGDVVVVEDPRQPGFELVKRAVRPVDDGWWIEGDAAGASTDSRTFGPVPTGSIRGRVVAVYAPARRAGMLRRTQAISSP